VNPPASPTLPQRDDVRDAPAGLGRDLLRRFYPEVDFGGFTAVDGTVHFYSRVNALLTPDAVLLDVGCGRGGQLRDDPIPFRRGLLSFKGRCRSVIGIDVDPAGQEHPGLDEFRLIAGPAWPVADASIDLCVGDWVLEHVPDPAGFLAELHRVLKPGGYACFRTTNRRSYLGLAASLIPNRDHTKVVRFVQADGRKERDVFPTTYRCNTPWMLRRALKARGFAACVYGYDAEPPYFSFSRILFALGVLHQRYMPKMFGIAIMAFARKQ
jgi:SAM-dependent methyltransferase